MFHYLPSIFLSLTKFYIIGGTVFGARARCCGNCDFSLDCTEMYCRFLDDTAVQSRNERILSPPCCCCCCCCLIRTLLLKLSLSLLPKLSSLWTSPRPKILQRWSWSKVKILDGDFNPAFTMVGIKVQAKGEGQEEDLNFALILVISPVEPAPLDRALGMEGDEPHSLRKLCK